jgi:hypothetical protein
MKIFKVYCISCGKVIYVLDGDQKSNCTDCHLQIKKDIEKGKYGK